MIKNQELFAIYCFQSEFPMQEESEKAKLTCQDCDGESRGVSFVGLWWWKRFNKTIPVKNEIGVRPTNKMIKNGGGVYTQHHTSESPNLKGKRLHKLQIYLNQQSFVCTKFEGVKKSQWKKFRRPPGCEEFDLDGLVLVGGARRDLGLMKCKVSGHWMMMRHQHWCGLFGRVLQATQGLPVAHVKQ